jgi:ketopantoate reductase
MISRLVVATKASDTVPALLSVCPRLAPSCEVALLQNGIMGVYEQVFQQVRLDLMLFEGGNSRRMAPDQLKGDQMMP